MNTELNTELTKKDVENMSFSEIGTYTFNLYNFKMQVQNLLEAIELKEKEIFDKIEKECPAEIDLEGKLKNTQIFDKETGEAIAILKWTQDVKYDLDIQKALQTIKEATETKDLTDEIFFEAKLKTKETLKKEMKNVFGLSSEAIDNCFTSIKRGKPKIKINKI